MVQAEMLEARVAAGAEFFDRQFLGWVSKIEKPVRVANTRECPMAQLYGRYRLGLEACGLSDDQALAFGLRSDSRETGTSNAASRAYYSALDLAWEREIKMRRR